MMLVCVHDLADNIKKWVICSGCAFYLWCDDVPVILGFNNNGRDDDVGAARVKQLSPSLAVPTGLVCVVSTNLCWNCWNSHPESHNIPGHLTRQDSKHICGPAKMIARPAINQIQNLNNRSPTRCDKFNSMWQIQLHVANPTWSDKYNSIQWIQLVIYILNLTTNWTQRSAQNMSFSIGHALNPENCPWMSGVLKGNGNTTHWSLARHKSSLNVCNNDFWDNEVC